MGAINWERLGNEIARAKPVPPKKFSDEEIAAAVAAVNALPGRKKNPDKVPTIWDRPKDMPTLADLDFRDVARPSVTIASLQASTKNLSRTRLLWHVQNPGQAKNPSVFTANPIVLDLGDSQVIVDGHHRLAALQLLGATKWPVWLIPTKDSQ